MLKNTLAAILGISTLLFSCNSNSAKTEDAAKNTTTSTVIAPVTNETATAGNGAVASFMINGSPAITTASEKDDGKHTSTFFVKDKILNVYIQGYIAPDTYRHQMMIAVKNFTPGTTGAINNATAQFARKDETKREFIYGNRKEGSYKLVIEKWEDIKAAGPYQNALISGTFEGDMNCETCFDPALKNSPFAQTQHITAGKFENIKVTFFQ